MYQSVPIVKSARSAIAATALLLSSFAVWTGLTGPESASASGVWGQATPVSLPAGHSDVEMFSVSCPSAGNCTAVGRYRRAAGGLVSFAVSSTGGTWGAQVDAAFAGGVQNANPNDFLQSVSCVSVGNCTAVGRFRNAAGGFEAFTMTSTAGSWGQATPAGFGVGVQNASPDAYLGTVVCASVGNCTAAGRFKNAAGGVEAFTMTSTAGTWGSPAPAVFAGGVQNAVEQAYFNDVSCASAGNCTAVGGFKNAAGDFEAFTMTSTAGAWGQATPVNFGVGGQNAAPTGVLNSVSCASVGNCTAAGSFFNASGSGTEAFTVTSTAGTWGTATPAVFAGGIQNANPNAEFKSVSCASVGNCTAAGSFRNATGWTEAFTMTSTGGSWAQARPVVYGARAQNTNAGAYFNAVSCAFPGYCTAVGATYLADGTFPAFTVTSNDGVWETPSIPAFAGGLQDPTEEGWLRSVSCATGGNCTTVGSFYDSGGVYKGFAISSVNNTPPTTTTVAPTTTVAATTTTSPTTTVAATTTVAPTTTVAAITTTVVPVSAKAKTASSAVVTFTPSKDGEPATAHEYSLDGGKTWKRAAVTSTAGGRLSFVVDGLDAGSDYEVTIRAVGASGTVRQVGVTSFSTSEVLPATGLGAGAVWLTGLLLLAAGGTAIAGRRRFENG